VTESDNSSLAFVGLDAESLAAGEGASTAPASNTQDGNNRATINQFAPGTANSANAFVGLDADPVGNGATAANTQTGTNAFALDQTAPTSSASVDSIAGQVIGAATAAGGSASFVAANLSDNNTVENVGVAGQVIGGVTAGTTSVDASNKSIDNEVVGGVTAGSNDATAFVGLDADAAAVGPRGGDAEATNNQIGSNRFAGTQSASTTSGEPVAGQIIGVVTTAGGSASIVAANVSDDNSVETGDATAPNTLFAFVGLDAESVDGIAIGAYATNTQVKGSNRVTVSETASATSGNGVAGQILGVVSAGATSVDATNDSTFNDVETGDALASNEATPTVGLLSVAQNATSTTVQNGNNRDSADQSAEATSGDAIAGQVGGVVTSAGASASVVLANTSMDIDAETGQAIFDNSDTAFVGLTAFNGLLTITLQ